MNPVDWDKYKKDIEPRMKKLEKNGQLLELAMFMSLILEKELQETISIYEELTEKAILKYDMQFLINKISLNKDVMTLGKLKDYFSVYCKNNVIIDEIKQFNDLRIKIVHRIFNHDVYNIENEISGWYPQRFYKILTDLVDLKINLIDLRVKELDVKLN
jgi:hypothetical protein